MSEQATLKMDEQAGGGGGGGPASERWLEETLDKVFITPRIVDERALEDLGGTLKDLVKDAGAQSQALLASTAEVKIVGDQLREATRELQAKVETAARVIPTLDQRVARAEQLLELTGKELSSNVSKFREVAAEGVVIDRDRVQAQVREETAGLLVDLLAEHGAALRERMAPALEDASATADERIGAMIARVREAEESLERSLSTADERARGVVERLETQIDDGLKRARESAEEGGRRAMELLSKPIDALENLLVCVEQAEKRAAGLQESLETSLSEAGTRLGAAVDEAERRTEALTTRAGARLEELKGCAIEVVELAASTKADDVLATAKDAVDAASRSTAAAEELRGMLAGVEDAAARCAAATEDARAIHAHVEAGRERLNETLRSAAAGMAPLVEQMNRLKADYQALVGETQSETGMRAQVRQAGAWLTQIVNQAAEVGNGLDRLMRQSAPLIAWLQDQAKQGKVE